MFGEKHDLLHELPEFRERILELKQSDGHFASLYQQYEEVEAEVHRLESGLENTSDEYLEERKKVRLALKDQLFQILRAQ